MNSIDRLTLRGVAFPFKTTRPRLAFAINILLLMGWPWFIAHPESFSKRAYHGPGAGIDMIIVSLSLTGRVIACLLLELYMVFMISTFYLPCIRYKSITIFDGLNVSGLNLWGVKKSVPLSNITNVNFSNGNAKVQSPEGNIRIPISSLEIDKEQKLKVVSILMSIAA